MHQILRYSYLYGCFEYQNYYKVIQITFNANDVRAQLCVPCVTLGELCGSIVLPQSSQRFSQRTPRKKSRIFTKEDGITLYDTCPFRTPVIFLINSKPSENPGSSGIAELIRLINEDMMQKIRARRVWLFSLWNRGKMSCR